MRGNVRPPAPPPPLPRTRRPTATSNFGVGRRESHDASGFYARFAPPQPSTDQEVRPPRSINEIWCHDAREMDPFVEDKSVALVVTSPPYFAGKAYEEALGQGGVPATYNDYRRMLFDVFEQCRNKLEPGGRIAVNVANLGRKPYRSLAADVIDILEQLGMLLRGEIIWKKGDAAGGSCAWGTYQRPGNPVLRDVTERIIVASKGRFDRALTAPERQAAGLPNEGSITMDEFVDATTDIWVMPAESATRVGHPAPFPVELPRRLIEMHTYRGDLVLDPFMGAGSTAIAALRTDRSYIGFDTEQSYVDLSTRRIAEERASLDIDRPRVVVPAAKPKQPADTPETVQQRATRTGEKAKELARELLVEAGFVDVESDARVPTVGADFTYKARDQRGNLWFFEIIGGFSVSRPGLKRPENVWRALGKASVVPPDTARIVFITTDVPARSAAHGKALDAAKGHTYHDVVCLADRSSVDNLATFARG